MHSFYRRLVKFLGSKTFWVMVLVVCLVSAVWIAISARYPMAFDEDYHLGLIKLHAQQWSPIFTHQPVGVAQFGALTRDPSYLYHYLMSFPYRLLTALNVSQMTLVVTLRLINVALFTASLPIFRRLLLKAKATPAIIHIALLFFVLTPVVPLLAATINYDNLQIMLIAYVLLLTVRFRERLLIKRFDLDAIGQLLTISLLASLVKFTYLPILVALAAYLPYALIRYGRSAKMLSAARQAGRVKSQTQKVFLAMPFIVAFVLFVNTYGVNLIKYQNPVPQCGQVLDVERCAAYAPWHRNYLAALSNKGVDPNPFTYTANWLGGMFDRLFFTINGHAKVADNANSLAPVMSAAAVIVAALGLYLAGRYGVRLLRRDGILTMLLFTSLVYTGFVWGRNYHDYIHLGRIVAVNGRYLIPILPPVYVFIALCYQRYLAGRMRAKAVLLGVSIILILQGGGAISFIYYSTPDWYWPGNQPIRHLNEQAKRVVDPLFVTSYLRTK